MKLYTITDEYGYKDYNYLYSVLDSAIEMLDVKGIFSVVFINDVKMHEMNKAYRGIDRTTDVLSFALNDNENNFEEELNVLGDIYVSIPKMKSQSVEYGHSEKRELSFLVVHGLLHLLGYDHMEKEDEKIMFSLQEEVLSHAGIAK